MSFNLTNQNQLRTCTIQVQEVYVARIVAGNVKIRRVTLPETIERTRSREHIVVLFQAVSTRQHVNNYTD